MSKTPRRIIASDIAALREQLGISQLDMDWLRGTKSRTFRLTGDQRNQVIANPVDALIFRYLRRYPEDYPLPAMPNVCDLLQRTEQAWQFSGYHWHQDVFSLILGCSNTATRNWVSGKYNVSCPVSRLMFLLDCFLKWPNSTDGYGLKLYLALVEQEARSRGFNRLDEFFSKRTWGRSADSESRSERLKQSSIHTIREHCGLCNIDALWLLGLNQLPTNNQLQLQVIDDPTLALLCRVLCTYPLLDFVPVMPPIGDPADPDAESLIGALMTPGIDEQLKKLSNNGIKTAKKGINGRKLGPLLGCSFMMGYTWTQPTYRMENMSNTTQRLAYLLVHAINKRGVQGFLDYLSVLREEVLSRGRSMEDFWKMGWPEWRGARHGAMRSERVE